jgi:rSAM/selenodomain-associated transferase 1
VPGRAKTRLAAGLGDAGAARLYRAFLLDLAARFAGVPYAVRWYATPAGAWAAFARSEPAVGAFPAVAQPPGDWTERQRALFRAVEPGDPTLLIASDSPQLGPAEVGEAFRALERHDLVLGPTCDGGYYLLGLRAPHDVLAGVAMSTEEVAASVLARARRLGLSTVVLEPTFDVDVPADLDDLRRAAAARPDLPATRAALAELRLPVPELAAAL